MRPQGPPPAWFVIAAATLVALVAMGGTVAILLVGRTVPDRLWDLDLMIGGAYFVGGPFSLVISHQSSIQAGLMDTANHAIAALRESRTNGGSTATGEGRQ